MAVQMAARLGKLGRLGRLGRLAVQLAGRLGRQVTGWPTGLEARQAEQAGQAGQAWARRLAGWQACQLAGWLAGQLGSKTGPQVKSLGAFLEALALRSCPTLAFGAGLVG